MKKSSEMLQSQNDSMTKTTHGFLLEKLESLKEKRQSIVDDLGGADFTSLLHDNVAVANRIQQLDAEISKVSAILSSSAVLPSREDISNVGIGNVVSVLYLDDKDSSEFAMFVGTTIDTSYFDNPNMSAVSIISPLGKELVGHSVGEIITYSPKIGVRLRAQIKEIKPESAIS